MISNLRLAVFVNFVKYDASLDAIKPVVDKFLKDLDSVKNKENTAVTVKLVLTPLNSDHLSATTIKFKTRRQSYKKLSSKFLDGTLLLFKS